MGASSRSQQLETDLKIEREWRQTLQSDLDRERGTVAQLSTEALQIKMLKQVKPESTVTVHDVPSLGFNEYDFNQTPRLFDVLPPQEFHRLQDENVQLKTICEDQEQALEELGSKLSEYVTLLPINVE